jgi:hypothetical protein
MVNFKVLNPIPSKSIVAITILPQVWKQKVFRKKVFKIVPLVMGAILNSFSNYFLFQNFTFKYFNCFIFRSTTILFIFLNKFVKTKYFGKLLFKI